MEYVTLSNGIKMPLVGFGTWDLRGSKCIDSVLEALNCGYRLIDTAKMYQNEREVGVAIQNSHIPREKLFITTKLDRHYNNYQSAKKGILESLKVMQLDYLDLVLIHEPYSHSLKMYQALEEAYDQGLIKAIGVSNFHYTYFKNFIKNCKIIPIVNQVETHVFFQQQKLQPILAKNQTVMEAWSPLATGKNNLFELKELVEIGNVYHKTAAQIALKYLIQLGIVVIPKSAHKKRMEENIDLFDFDLTEDQMAIIKKLDTNQSLFNWYDYQ